MRYIVSIPLVGTCEQTFRQWALAQDDRVPYVEDFGPSHGRLWIVIVDND